MGVYVCFGYFRGVQGFYSLYKFIYFQKPQKWPRNGPKDIKVRFGRWGPTPNYKSTCPKTSKTKLESNHELIDQETNYSWKWAGCAARNLMCKRKMRLTQPNFSFLLGIPSQGFQPFYYQKTESIYVDRTTLQYALNWILTIILSKTYKSKIEIIITIIGRPFS